MKRIIFVFALLAAHETSAQQSSRGVDTMIVMTVPLRHLSGDEAVQLLTPYATTPAYTNQPAGGVFSVPGGQAVTIREKISQYGRMLALLREYDRAPRLLEFNYQVILADKSTKRLDDVVTESMLRNSLKFTGYSLIGSGMLRSGIKSDIEAVIENPDYQYKLELDVAEPPGTASDASSRMDIILARSPWPVDGKPSGDKQFLLVSRDVRIPLSQTVVLGTKALDRDRAIILIMRPELSRKSLTVTLPKAPED